jgi:hypothetical protein
MKTNLCYIDCWRLDNKQIYLLWCDGEPNPDYYVVNDCFEPRLLTTSTKEALVECANKRDLQISDQPVNVLDFDAVEKRLAAIRLDRSLPMKSSVLFLNIWNTLDDVSHSISQDLMASDLYSSEELNYLYEKLFFGNNLESITPEGKKYYPILVAREREILRNLFGAAIEKLRVLVS